jgi:hypothetical protein
VRALAGRSDADPVLASRPTYVASVSGQATTAAVLLSIESSATTGFRISRICWASSSATATAAVTVTVRRTTTASSAGTALTAEGTGTTAVSKMDPADPNFGGTARLGGTPGTAGAVLDQFGFVAPAANALTGPLCQTYGDRPTKMPQAALGTANGISVNVSAAGAGGLAAGTISVEFVADN